MEKQKEPFKLYDNYFGKVAVDGNGTIVWGYENISSKRINEDQHIPKNGGCFGYVDKGVILLKDGDKSVMVNSGFWFSTKSGPEIKFISDKYRIAIWQLENYTGVLSLGEVENEGRLNYIDNCKDSILHAPIKKGLPCLNALFMPEGVYQTRHTHPSTRSGFIIDGGAICETIEENFDLKSGNIFVLNKDAEHNFRSDHGLNITMKLVAYHPDSDFGPTDETHPMINRTIVNGISASEIDEIRTK